MTTLAAAELAAVVPAYPELGRFVALRDNGLSVNSATCLFETTTGVYFAKRLAPADWQWPVLEAEHRLSDALRTADFPTPRVLRNAAGESWTRHEGLAYAITDRARGEDRYRGVPVFDAYGSAAEAAEAGAMLARFHQAAAGLALPSRPFRGLVARYALFDTPDLAGLDALLAEAPALAAFVAARAGWPELAARMRALASRIAPGLAECPRGVIHGDFIKRNLFWQGDRVVDVVDLDLWNVGPWLYDLALALLPCGFDWPALLAGEGAPRAPHLRAMLRGYAAARPLTADERALLPSVMESARFEFYLSAIAAQPERAGLFWNLLLGTTRWFADHPDWAARLFTETS